MNFGKILKKKAATQKIACVASVSVRFRRKERGMRVKDCEKSGASKGAGRGSRFISRVVKTESPLPWYFFAPKPNGNACYAGYPKNHQITTGFINF